MYTILVGSLAIRRFPTFCGALIGGYTILQWPLRILFYYICVASVNENTKRQRFLNAQNTASRFISAFISAWFSLQLLNSKKRMSPKPDREISKQRQHGDTATEIVSRTPVTSTQAKVFNSDLAGKTIDLTLLAVTRALEAVIVDLWRGSNPSTTKKAPITSTSAIVYHYSDALVFALSSGTVMWAWFYFPEHLPHAYNKWIGEAAQVDIRLIELLRRARRGELVYGKKTSQTPVLQSMCEDYGWPLKWGDPAITVPIPCEVVHMGAGPSCHWHATVRFWRAFRFALATNLPLQLLAKSRKPSFRAFKRACGEAMRSSAFLGAFVALFYYGVCLSRTRLGPHVFSSDTITPAMWDSGLCVRVGCILCGWSILIEAEKRRQELGMFVAPRALATLLPRQYDKKVHSLIFEHW